LGATVAAWPDDPEGPSPRPAFTPGPPSVIARRRSYDPECFRSYQDTHDPPACDTRRLLTTPAAYLVGACGRERARLPGKEARPSEARCVGYSYGRPAQRILPQVSIRVTCPNRNAGPPHPPATEPELTSTVKSVIRFFVGSRARPKIASLVTRVISS
jgi:hypothetical protein